jgi:hypothetical protein
MSIYSTFKKMQSGPVMIGIAIFGILTFTITYAVNQTFARDPRLEKNTSVTLPSGATAKFSEVDRSAAQTAYSLFLNMGGSNPIAAILFDQRGNIRREFIPLYSQVAAIQPWTASEWHAAGDAKKKAVNNEVEQIMLVNAVARDRGLDVASGEVSQWLDKAFATPEMYRQVCAYLGMTYPQFQAAVREAMLYKRAVDLILAQAPLPSGEEIVSEWCERNERFTFDAVVFSAEERKKAIDEKAITNEELQKWLDGKLESDKAKYLVPEKFELDGLAILNENAASSGKLHDAFDPVVKSIVVQDSDLATYYAIARMERFKKPAPESKPESAPETSPSTRPAVEFFALDEKKAEATRELQIGKALEKVKAELQQASTQPGFDVKAFGEKYGLVYWKTESPVTLAELRTIPLHGCTTLVAAVSDVKEGEFFATYQAAPGAIQITRLVKRTKAAVPAAAEIRDKVLPDYLDEKTFTSAKEDATKFRDAVEDARDGDAEGAFEKVVKEKGLEAKRLAPISKGANENRDVEYDKLSKDVSQYLASLHRHGVQRRPDQGPDPFVLKKGAVSQPITNDLGKAVYVVRCAERQLPTKQDMGPGDYSRFKERRLTELRQRKCFEAITSGSLEKLLKLERKTGASQ